MATNLVNSFDDPELGKRIFGSEQQLDDGGFPSLSSSLPIGRTRKGNANRNKARGHRTAMVYPVAQGPREETGDRLLIKCFEYEPAKTGFRFTKTVDALKNEEGGLSVVTNVTQDKAGNDIKTITTSGIEGATIVNEAGGANKQKPNFYISLPIPQEVNDSNAITWGDDSLNIFQLAGLSIASGAIGLLGGNQKTSFQDAIGKVTELGLKGISEIDPQTQEAVVQAITGKAINAVGGNLNVNSVIGRSTGLALNNNLELLFNGVTLRTFPFNVTFTPRSQKESQVVLEIIRSLKSAMAAKKNATQGQGGIFLRAPDVFTLRYLHNGKDHPFLNRIKDCALTGLSVNYTGAGTYASYFDGSPVAINMSMTFKELNPVYHEDYSNAIGGVGY